jgi:aryl-phospho-beta-D-glucosidase BglC (GH1 family)
LQSNYWANNPAVIQAHRTNFINDTTIHALQNKGVSLVRIPLGHWASATSTSPYIPGALSNLDSLEFSCSQTGIKMLLTMHAAPGSQNGFDHSSPEVPGQANWCTSSTLQDATLSVLQEWMTRYSGRSTLWGICVLNEPACDESVLLSYYDKAYSLIRSVSSSVRVVISPNVYAQMGNVSASDWRALHLRTLSAWGKGKVNVALDLHLYQTDWALGADVVASMSVQDHINYAKYTTQPRIANYLALGGTPLIIGEWSLAGPNYSKNSKTKSQQMASFKSAQLGAFNQPGVIAHFYWSARVDNNDVWSML